MNRTAKIRFAVVALVVALGLWMLVRSCSAPAPVAVLQAMSGAVRRDVAASVGHWSPAVIQAEFHVGDGVQTLGSGTAQLLLDDGSLLSLNPDTTVRFLPDAPKRGGAAFDVTTGEALLETGGRELMVQTSLGLAKIEAGSKVQLSHTEQGLKFLVHLGTAQLGDNTVLQPGIAVRLGLAGQVEVLGPESLDGAQPAEPAPGIDAVVEGSGVSVQAGGDPEAEWTALGAGEVTLAPGSTVQLGADDQVRVSRGAQSAELIGAGRYQLGLSPETLVQTAEGELLVGGAGAVRVAVPGGIIVIPPAGRAKISATGQSSRVDIHERSAQVVVGERVQPLDAGQSAIVEEGGSVELRGVGLARFDVQVQVGQSWVIHDPSPPAAVRFEYAGLCPGVAAVELTAGKRVVDYAAGPDSVSLQVRRGVHQYRVRCLLTGGQFGPVQHTGKLSVLRDAGTRGLPAKAPVSKLVADGRDYTVLYQNRLPEIELSWRSAPPAGPFELKHLYRKKEKVRSLATATYRYSSGQLREGTHTFFFQGSGKISRRTTVQIRFDNAAPTASLDSPKVGGAAPGQSARVIGLALPGSKVRVGDEPAHADRHGRFRLNTVFPEDGSSLAVRIEHPRRGNHIYLRRSESP